MAVALYSIAIGLISILLQAFAAGLGFRRLVLNV